MVAHEIHYINLDGCTKFVLSNGVISPGAYVHNACCITPVATNISSNELVLRECVCELSHKYVVNECRRSKI